MSIRRRKCAAALSLVEVMVTVAVLAITTLGALSYQYHAARHADIANKHMTAIRTAQLLLEDWKSTGGSNNYDPTALGLGFSSVSVFPYFSEEKWAGVGAPLRSMAYRITVNNVPMLAMLLWKDVAHDSVAEVTLRQLAVVVQIRSYSDIPPIVLVPGTYVRLDAAGG